MGRIDIGFVVFIVLGGWITPGLLWWFGYGDAAAIVGLIAIWVAGIVFIAATIAGHHDD